MAVWRINHFANATTVKEQFIGWEEMLEITAPTYKLFNIGAPVNTLKVEMAKEDETTFSWAIGATNWNATDTTALPISTALEGAITNYAVLKVENEIVVVKSVDRTAHTIEVYKRWAWETTGATHTAGTTAHILGFNMPRWVKDIEANYKAQVVDWNFVGKYTVPSLKFTKEALVEARSYYGEGGKADYVSDQILEKDKDLLRTVNKLLLNGTREEGANESEPGMTRGLIEEATLRGNVVTSFGAISSLQKIQDALTASRNKWGKANVLLCGPSTFDDIQKLGVVENQLPQILDRLSVELGTTVVALNTKVGKLYLVMDTDMDDDKFIVLNTTNISLHPFEGFTTPGWDRTESQESARNDQAFIYDSLTQFVTAYKNSNRDMTICTGVTH